MVDGNGIELFTGQYYADGPYISVGSGQSSMGNHFYNHGNGWTADYISGLQISGSVATATVGSASDTFSISGTTYTSLQGNGSTLTYSSSSNSYTYTNRNGTVVSFSPPGVGVSEVNQFALQNYNDVVSTITKPDGETITYSYQDTAYCTHWGTSNVKVPAQCTASGIAFRVASVTSSNGYELVPTYASNSVTSASSSLAVAPAPIAYITPTGVNIYNLAVSTSTPAASQSFTWTTSGSNDTYSLTDAAQNVYLFLGNVITGVQTPASTSPQISITYNGVVSGVTNAHGTTSYSRNTTGNTLTVTSTDALSNASTYTFDITTGQMLSYTDPIGNKTSGLIDSYGRLTQVTQPEGDAKQYSYDTRGNVLQVTVLPKSSSSLPNIITKSSFDASCANVVKCNQPNWTQDALGNETDYTYDTTSGLLTSVTAPAAASGGTRPQTRYSYTQMDAYYYNSSGSIATSGVSTYVLTGTSTCQTLAGATLNGTAGGSGQFSLSGSATCAGTSDEIVTTTNYGAQNNGTGNNLWPIYQTVAAGDGSLSAKTSQAYDSVGNVLSQTGPLGSGQVTYSFYDADRRTIGMISPDPDGTGSRTPTAVEYTYNADGAVTQTSIGTVPNQATTLSGFTEGYHAAATLDSYDRPIRTSSVSSSTNYAVNDLLYDALGRNWCSIQYMNLSAVPSTIATTSCAASQTTGPFGADRITQVTFDKDGRVLTQSDNLRTLATKAYYADGEVSSVTDGNGNQTSYTYDGFNRLSQANLPVVTVGSNVSDSNDYETYSYYANGNLNVRTLRDGNTLTYAYDNLGRVMTRTPGGTAATSSNDNAVTYTYNLTGTVAKILRAADGSTLTYSYDALGRLINESQPFGSTAYQYDAGGDLTQITWADGFYASYSYDMSGGVTSVTANGATSGVGVLASYSYDSLGRRSAVSYGNGTGQSYAYDAVGRLAGLQLSFPNATNNNLIGGVGGSGTPISYTPSSQISSITRSNNAYIWSGAYDVSRSYTANGLNQYSKSGGVNLTYDGRGNLVGSTPGSNITTTYSYTKLNELSAIADTGVSIYYDPLSRVSEYDTAASTRFYYVGGTPVAEVANPSGTVMQRYVPGPGTDEVVAWYSGSGNTTTPQFLLADERGSVVAVTDSSGALIAANSYDEYGIPASSNVGRFGYTGQTWFPEAGLYNYKARWYSPSLGRFMQTDPSGYGDGLNWYNYTHGDPINGSDPTGLDDDGGGDWIDGIDGIDGSGFGIDPDLIGSSSPDTTTPPPCTGAEICVNGTPPQIVPPPDSYIPPLSCTDCLVVTYDPAGQAIINVFGHHITPGKAQNTPDCSGPRFTIGGGVSGTLFAIVLGGSAGAGASASVPISSLRNFSLRGLNVTGSLSVTPLVGVGGFIGAGPNLSGGVTSNSNPTIGGPYLNGSVTPVIQVGAGDGEGVEVQNTFTNPFSISGAMGRLAAGAYAAFGAQFAGNLSTGNIGCRN
jgi:RHS repeat-associated protein